MLSWIQTLTFFVSNGITTIIEFFGSALGYFLPLQKLIFYAIDVGAQFYYYVPHEIVTVVYACFVATIGLNLYRLISRLT